MLTSRFDQALTLARTLHADQRRKGGDVPYLAHQLRRAVGELQAARSPA